MPIRVFISSLLIACSPVWAAEKPVRPENGSEMARKWAESKTLNNLPYERRAQSGLDFQAQGQAQSVDDAPSKQKQAEESKNKARRSIEEALGLAPNSTTRVLDGDGKPLSPIPPAKPTFEMADDLDGLFAQLKRTADNRRAKRISTKIWSLWQSSDSKSIDLLTHWAREATAKRKFSTALDLLDQVVTLRPNYSEGWNQRATLHYMMKDFNKSIADIERVLALEPRHYGALAGLAGILQQMGRKEAALEAWYRALSVYPAMGQAQKAVLDLEEDLAGRGI